MSSESEGNGHAKTDGNILLGAAEKQIIPDDHCLRDVLNDYGK
jgi:hypothetical protein